MGQARHAARQPADQRYESAYLFGAICPARGIGAALALPFADTEAMQLHLDEISRRVANGAHAVCSSTAPAGTRPQSSTSRRTSRRSSCRRASPELNPVENVWQYLRANWLSNRVFDTYDAIIDAACEAWNKLIAQPDTITSIGMRDWAHVGQFIMTVGIIWFDALTIEQCSKDTVARIARRVREQEVAA